MQTAPCGLSHLGTRRGWAGQEGGWSYSPSHVPRGFTGPSPLSPLLQVGGLRTLPAPMTRAGKVLGPAQPGHRNEDIRTMCSPGNRASTISFYFVGIEPKVTRKNKSQRGPYRSGPKD